LRLINANAGADAPAFTACFAPRRYGEVVEPDAPDGEVVAPDGEVEPDGEVVEPDAPEGGVVAPDEPGVPIEPGAPCVPGAAVESVAVPGELVVGAVVEGGVVPGLLVPGLLVPGLPKPPELLGAAAPDPTPPAWATVRQPPNGAAADDFEVASAVVTRAAVIARAGGAG